MRERILAIVPDAEDVVSYGMPAFRVRGTVIAGLKAAKNHVGYYPFSGSVIDLFKADLKSISSTKSAIQVPITSPLSRVLLKKLLDARISQCPVKRGEVDLTKNSSSDGYWRQLGLAAPARRGLVDMNIVDLSGLRTISRSEFQSIHGIGDSAAQIVIAEMKKHRVTFKSGR
jgi:uncharacterized protein YdhG (YjbR/CyaY superfamily)